MSGTHGERGSILSRFNVKARIEYRHPRGETLGFEPARLRRKDGFTKNYSKRLGVVRRHHGVLGSVGTSERYLTGRRPRHTLKLRQGSPHDRFFWKMSFLGVSYRLK